MTEITKTEPVTEVAEKQAWQETLAAHETAREAWRYRLANDPRGYQAERLSEIADQARRNHTALVERLSEARREAECH